MAWPCKFGARVRFVFLFFFVLRGNPEKNIKGDKDKNNTHNENNFL